MPVVVGMFSSAITRPVSVRYAALPSGNSIPPPVLVDDVLEEELQEREPPTCRHEAEQLLCVSPSRATVPKASASAKLKRKLKMERARHELRGKPFLATVRKPEHANAVFVRPLISLRHVITSVLCQRATPAASFATRR